MSIVLADSHCHIDMIDDDPRAVIARARSNDVKLFINVCVDIANSDKVLELTEIEGVYASVGQHPCSTYDNFDVDRLVSLVKENVVAIGETGLDFYRIDNPANHVQINSFEAHIDVAKRTGLPLIIHCRAADEEVISVLKQHKGVGFVMHSFGGDVDFARLCLDLGGYISFSGIVTFKNAVATHLACEYVPMDRMLIETDSPYLAPVPHRGKPNEPAFVRHVAECIASIKELSIEDVAYATTRNFIELFNLVDLR